MADIEMDRPNIPVGIPTFNLVFNAISKLQKDYQQFKDDTNKRLDKLENPVGGIKPPDIMEKKEKEEKKVTK